MKKIFVPLDFSNHSKLVYRFALEMAKKMKGSLTLYHAFLSPFNESVNDIIYSKTIDNLALANRKELDQIVKRYTSKNLPKIEISTKVEFANPVEGILKNAKELPSDLVIMGMRNKNILDDFLFGSVTKKVLKEFDQPILIIPPEYTFKPIDNILYLSHYGFSQLKNLRLVGEWANEWDINLHCVCIASQNVVHKELIKYQEKLKITCNNDLQASFQIISPDQDIKEGVSDYIKRYGSPMLALDHHDRTLQKLLHTGKETSLVRRLHMPVLFLAKGV